MKAIGAVVGVLAIAGALMADDQERRRNLPGSWELRDVSKSDGTTHLWIFDSKPSGIRIVHSLDGRTVADFECNTFGNECDVKVSGHKATVLLYYSGAKLVELETKGSEVVKRRFSVDGDTMELEEIPVIPAGKSETLKFRRVQVATGASQRH